MIELLPDSAELDGELTLGGLAAEELGARFGTPLVVYCEATLRARARALRAAAGGGFVAFGT